MPNIVLDIGPNKAQALAKPPCALRTRPQARKAIFDARAAAGLAGLMGIRNARTESGFQRSSRRVVARKKARGSKRPAMAAAELKAALEREEALRREKRALLQRQNLLTQEFEHRLVNSLQMIVSLLSLQGRAATTPEVTTQLKIAAGRVAAFGRVHRQLHHLDHQKSVELKQYLRGLCDDLAGLLFQDGAGRAVVVTGAEVKLPTALGIPLGFVVNELITNSAKYAQGDITVSVETSATALSLSVADEGPGLPAGFDPARSKGLGMKIVQALVRRNGGVLRFAPGDGGRGARTTVVFAPPPRA